MNGTTAPADSRADAESPATRTRDARTTRLALLNSARRRFAKDGYAATTVRDIASDAGVNVALINRYFTSKEGLFEACLARTVEDLDRRDLSDETVEQVVREVTRQVAQSTGDGYPLQLLLLLRSSGDEAAERIRRHTFRIFTERMAATAGWKPDDPETAPLLLRAQLAMSVATGIVMLRFSSGLEPLTSATEEELAGPIREVFEALLTPSVQ